MGSSVEYQVRCSRCGHAHDESIEWLMARGEVECPADGCGAKIQIHIGDLTAPAQISGEPGEVFDLSTWKSALAQIDLCSARRGRAGQSTAAGAIGRDD